MRKKTIFNWLETNIMTKGWMRYEDIHLDEIYPNVTKSQWIELGLRELEFVSSKASKLNFVAVLAIGLKLSSKEKLENCESLDQLERNFDESPPSIYIFPYNSRELSLTVKRSKSAKDIAGSSMNYSLFFYSEYSPERKMFLKRSVLVISKDSLKSWLSKNR